jgi:hypothetical protein
MRRAALIPLQDELHQWLDDHGWVCDELRSDGSTLWRWPINDVIVDVPASRNLRKNIALCFFAADIMERSPEHNRVLLYK